MITEDPTSASCEAILDQAEILAKVETPEERDVLRDKVKFGYSKDVLSLNQLLDADLDTLVSLSATLESTTSKRYGTHAETRDQLDWLIERHTRNIERIKETLKVYEDGSKYS